MPALHGARKQHASEFARGNRRQRTLKEDPNVAAFSRTRTFQGRHVSRKARESYSHAVLSKSAARNQHVSSGRRAYTPMVSLPKRWSSMTASVSGRNFRVFWSTFFRSSGRHLLMAFQSCTTAGIYRSEERRVGKECRSRWSPY